MDTPSRFCDKCQAIQFNDAEWGGYVALDEDGKTILKFDEDDRPRVFEIPLGIEDIYPSFPFLSKSAADGCDCCNMLKDSASKAFAYAEFNCSGDQKFQISVEYRWGPHNVEDVKIRRAGSLSVLEINFILEDGQNPGLTLSAMHYIQSSRYSKVSEPVNQKRLFNDLQGICQNWLNLDVMEPGKVMTPKTISWIQSNLNSCQRCEEFLHSQFIPTRLVQVDCDPPRLVETNEPTNPTVDLGSIKYAAVSYCWGSPNEVMLQLKTEKNSLRNRLSGIPEAEIVGVLRDAITVCRALSISFLWIDALCILQDNPEDWERESFLMGQIYSGAYLTICALSSSSCAEGFLDRRVTLNIPFRSQVVSGVEGNIYLTRALDPFYDATESYIASDTMSSLWHNRGWTYQERFMSMRLLMFGDCRSHLVCRHKWQSEDKSSRFQEYFGQLYNIVSERNIDDIYASWHNTIGEYSGRLFTYPADLFPAISGVARFFNEKLRDEYVAGLWRRRLHEGLTWECSFRDARWLGLSTLLRKLTDTTTYIAPSWSWASRTHYVDLSHLNSGWRGITECGSITSHIRLMGRNPYGRISNATLRVTTKVVGVPTDDVSKTNDNKCDIYVGSCKQPYARCTVDWGLGLDGEPLKNVPPGRLMLMLLGTNPYGHPAFRSSSVGSMAGYDVSSGEEEEEEEGFAFGLIIYAIPDTENFVRVGVFRSWVKDGWGPRIFDDCEPMTLNLI